MESKNKNFLFINFFRYYSKCAIKAKSPNIRKYDLEKKLTKLTYEAIINSQVFEENKDNKEFIEYLEFMKSEI